MNSSSTHQNPAWWSAEHDSRWDRVKAAFRRDWEQTKHDFGSDKARDLQQSAADTVKQAAGSHQQSAGTMDRPYEQLEPAFRYGHGARTQFGGGPWNDDLETRMKDEYSGDYARDRDYIRRGYDYPPPL
ncbi:MAG: hypothetical protein K0Q76_4184 [Panacagrimonas sp.]|jgi:hypothetical protein|nr:hypothetical protein [Panacagrimonas sp.]MCC2659076.1 hypothetical protein [Panacagrimonas sp.]